MRVLYYCFDERERWYRWCIAFPRMQMYTTTAPRTPKKKRNCAFAYPWADVFYNARYLYKTERERERTCAQGLKNLCAYSHLLLIGYKPSQRYITQCLHCIMFLSLHRDLFVHILPCELLRSAAGQNFEL